MSRSSIDEAEGRGTFDLVKEIKVSPPLSKVHKEEVYFLGAPHPSAGYDPDTVHQQIENIIAEAVKEKEEEILKLNNQMIHLRSEHIRQMSLILEELENTKQELKEAQLGV